LIALLVGPLGLVLIGAALFDAFETIVVPRRVSRRLRLPRLFYWLTWKPYTYFAKAITDGPRRETFLSFFGPLSLLGLVGTWAIILIIGFGALQWSVGPLLDSSVQQRDFGVALYFSGTTFFTLGLGDVVPHYGAARVLTVVEAGTGFALLALLIGYLPVVYQMFARRETNVSLLDQRAGSPPTAAEFVRRNVHNEDLSGLLSALHELEFWIGDLLESHLSYPTLSYFRSQHENQSWVGALAVILDVSAFIVACGSNSVARQAAFTFAVARHAVSDLTNVLGIEPIPTGVDRLDEPAVHHLWEVATRSGLVAEPSSEANQRLAAIRNTYEPYLRGLSEYLLMGIPGWAPECGALDNWETTAWDFASPVSVLGPQSPFDRT
jgi:Ion channel